MVLKSILFLLFFFIVISLTAQVDTIHISSFTFEPENITVQTGDTLIWINMSNTVHTTTSGENCKKDGKWNSGELKFNETFRYVFKKPGKFPYFCIPHCEMGMRGSIIVIKKK
jgi:plastocyanin